MRIRFSPRSRDDLVDILEYIDRHSATGAKSVRAAIARSLRLIGQVPLIGADAGDGIRCVPVPRYPYLVYYQVDEGGVDVLHVRHAARERDPLL